MIFEMEKEVNKPGQVSLELTEEVAEGTYSNLAIIAHSSSEFGIDFARIVPNMPKAKVKSRVILTPEHAKRLLLALQDNVSRYEMKYGAINKPDRDEFSPNIPMNFGNSGEA